MPAPFFSPIFLLIVGGRRKKGKGEIEVHISPSKHTLTDRNGQDAVKIVNLKDFEIKSDVNLF